MKAQEEAEMKAQEEAEMKVQQEAEMKAQEEAELKANEEAEMKAKEEAESNTQEAQSNNGSNDNFAAKSDTNKDYSYLGNSNTMKLHRVDCHHAKKTSESNRVYFNSKDEASSYEPCKV